MGDFKINFLVKADGKSYILTLKSPVWESPFFNKSRFPDLIKRRINYMKNENSGKSKTLDDIIRRKWIVSLSLSAVVMVVYFTFLGMLALNREFFAGLFWGNITVGIPLGIGLIIMAWLMTGIYVLWANKYHDASLTKDNSEG